MQVLMNYFILAIFLYCSSVIFKYMAAIVGKLRVESTEAMFVCGCGYLLYVIVRSGALTWI